MNKKFYSILVLLFFLSRLAFVNPGPVFFDSGEFLSLFSISSFSQAIISGHFPPHVGYILIFWPIYQASKIFFSNPAYVVVLGQIILSFITLYCFYRFLSFIADKKTALLATIIIALLPIYWIANETIMMESAYLTFFIASLYLLVRYLTNKKNVYLHFSALFLGFSFITHMLVVLWLPFYLAIVYFKHRRKILTVTITLIVYFAIISLINVLFISIASKTNLYAVIRHLYLTKGGELAYLPSNFSGLLIAARNFLVPFFSNNTILIVLMGFSALVVLFFKDKKNFILSFLWIAPAVFANQWWDSLLAGRHSLIASFGLAFLVAYLVKNRNIIPLVVIPYLLLVSIPALNLLKKEIPYIKEAEYTKTLPKDNLLLESHFARPQIEGTFKGKIISVNEPGLGRDVIAKEINKSLVLNKPVFVTSAAISEPYGLYSGPYLHSLTLSYAKPFELTTVINKYTLKTFKVLNKEDNLIIYRVVSAKRSSYPKVKNMKYSYRRIGYYDPFWQLTAFIERKFNFSF